MWVVDASAVGELLLSATRGPAVESIMKGHVLYAPQLLVAEFGSLLRGLVLGGHVSESRAAGALDDFQNLGIEWVDMPPLLPAAWSLRHNISAYEAMYVVLAEALGCKVLTFDARLAEASDRCIVPS